MLAVSAGLLVGFWKPKWMKRALWGFVGMVGIFTAYIGIILLNPETEPCFCIGLNDAWNLNWEQHLAMNAGILLVAWQATLLYHTNGTLQKYKDIVAQQEGKAQIPNTKAGKKIHN